MGILSWIIVALLVSVFAKLIFGVGKLLFWLILGVVGASLFGWIGTLIGIGAIAVFGLAGAAAAFVGAALFVIIGRLLRGIFGA